MDKKDVIKALIGFQEENLSNLRRSLGVVKNEAVDAPGANVSHSDTSKFQQSNLALGIQARIEDAERALALVKGLPETKSDVVAGGSFFSVRDQADGEIMYYLFTSIGGGDTFEVGGKEVTTISAEAPLIKVLKGKKKGDKVVFGNKEFYIVEIQ